MLRIVFAIATATVFNCTAFATDIPVKPNPEVTTGDFCTKSDRDFAGYRYKERIAYCQRNVSRELKAFIYEVYGIPKRCRDQFTVDHFIPLSMGGSNQDANLWPEHKDVKATRQNLELEVYHALSDGKIRQAEAVEMIARAKLNPPPVTPSPCR